MARRRFGGRNAIRSVFSILWIALGCLSAFYLFTLFTGQTAAVSRTAATAPSGPAPAAQAPAAAVASSGPSSADVSALQGNIQQLSQQLAALDGRLRPIESFIGPAAKLPPSNSVSTSMPTAEPKPQPAPKPVVQAPPPKPAPAPEPAAAPAPKPEPQAAAAPKPQQQAAPVAAPPPAAPPPASSAPAAAPPAPEPAAQAEVAEEQVDVAAIDPVALPPAANDGSTRYGIEIGSVASRDELRPLWREYLTKHAALVAGLQPRRVHAPDNKWRLIAGPFANAQDAEGACSLFKRANRPCAATVYAGDAL